MKGGSAPAVATRHPFPVSPPITRRELDALSATLQRQDDIRPDIALPPVIRLDYDREHSRRCFAASALLWTEGSDRRALAAIATRIARGRMLAAEGQEDFRRIRARFKQLRFAWVTFDARHRFPPRLHWITRTMGKLQDALKNGRARRAAGHAAVLRMMTTPLFHAAIRRSSRGFRPCDAAGLRGQFRRDFDAIHALLAEREVSAKHFHEVRKIIGRMVGTYNSFNVLYPSDYHHDVLQVLRTINGTMGGLHDGMIARKLSGTQDYHGETFALPEPVANSLRTLERAFAAADRSAAARRP